MTVDDILPIAKRWVREQPPDALLPPFAVVITEEKPPTLVLFGNEEFEDRHHQLRRIINTVHPTQLYLCYDGYVTKTTTEDCTVCLNDEDDRTICDHCRHTGREPDAFGRRDAIIIVELRKGNGPIMHSHPYERVSDGVLFAEPFATPIPQTDSEYPSL